MGTHFPIDIENDICVGLETTWQGSHLRPRKIMNSVIGDALTALEVGLLASPAGYLVELVHFEEGEREKARTRRNAPLAQSELVRSWRSFEQCGAPYAANMIRCPAIDLRRFILDASHMLIVLSALFEE